MPDAVVIGAGPNGLAAANVLVDAGWSVVVLEANEEPGGAVRTAEVTAPGFRNDLFSAFYPFGAASPVFARFELERYGLRWVHAPAVLANPTAAGPTAVLSRDLDLTAANLDTFARGDGDGWRDLYGQFDRIAEPLIEAMLGPFPPVRAGARLAARLRARGALDFARLALLSVRRMGAETFRGEGGSLLLAGNAMHADISPEGAGSGMLGLLLAALGQRVGFPAPAGGAQRLIDALVARLRARGGELVCGARVARVVVRDRRAVGVELANGDAVSASRAVLADTDAVALYKNLIGEAHLPARVVNSLRRFERGPSTIKVDWAVSSPIPWSDPAIARAGTVHITDSMAELSTTAAQIASGFAPAKPFVLVGQRTTTDPTRSPAGTESAWGYAHVPNGRCCDAGSDGITGQWDARETEAFVGRIEDRIEAHAPGFRSRVLARHVFSPPALEAADANLVGGDLSGGTAQLHQELVFRPVPGLARPETPIRGLYLASASAHPGPGVHGACGSNAARAAIAHDRLRFHR
jgi:phytoene dehydrogenase-like protein